MSVLWGVRHFQITGTELNSLEAGIGRTRTNELVRLVVTVRNSFFVCF